MAVLLKETKKGWIYRTPDGKKEGIARVKDGEERTAEEAARIIAEKYGYDLDDISGQLGVTGRMDLLGLTDEIGGAARYLRGEIGEAVGAGKSQYKNAGEAIDKVRLFQELYHLANPKSSWAQRIAGGFLGGAPAKGAAQVGGALTAGTAKQAARGAMLGTGAGAVTGAGTSEGGFDLEGAANRLIGAAGGAVIGGLLGGTIPIATAGIGKLWRVGKDMLTKNPESPQTRAVLLRLVEMIKADDMTTGQAAARVGKMGDQAVIADVAGENVAGMAQAAASLPGKMKNRTKRVLDQRQYKQGERVQMASQEQLGTRGDFHGTMKEIFDARAAKAKPFYKEAYEREMPLTAPLRELMERGSDWLGPLWKTALKTAKLDKRKLVNAIEIGEDGSVSLRQRPDMATWDYIKRALDDLITTETRQGNIGSNISIGLKQLRTELLDELDQLNPAYKAARAAWSGGKRAEEALELGRNFLKVESDLVPAELKKMLASEQDFFREGVTRKLKDIIVNTGDSLDVVRKIFGTKELRDRLRAVFPDTKSFRQFQKTMLTEAKFAQTKRDVHPKSGSQTARLQAEQDALSGDLARWGIGMLTGDTREVVGSVARRVARPLGRGVDAPTSEAMADVLMSQGVAGNKATLARAQQLADAVRLHRGGPNRMGILGAVAGGSRDIDEQKRRLSGLLGN